MPATVAVVITTYNQAVYIGETIESVPHETYQDCEIVLVDDGSTDGTRGVLSPYRVTLRLRSSIQLGRGRPSQRAGVGTPPVVGYRPCWIMHHALGLHGTC